MSKKKYHKPTILVADNPKNLESVQLAGVSPRSVLFIKSKLAKRK